ncbi:glycoside hydrolase family 38 C-terminal domain-containing protein, partial [Enterocloster sp.]|uniref:glycoside hydrolase family 38 C-terminal domain-containing protein n=1 Tax=Enterocloster sp. TaxID=2719315 RepID=UPI00283E9D2F
CGGNRDAGRAVDAQCGGDRDAGRTVDALGTLFVANQLGFDRSGLVETVVNGQKRLLLAENVPSKGVLAFGLTGLEESEEEERPGVVLSCETGGSGFLTGLRTEFYDLRFDGQGQIVSLYDRREEREVIAPGGAGNALVVFEDRPESYDAWNIDESYEEKQWTVTDVTRLELVENTAVRAVVRCEKRFMKSVVRQDICFYRHTGRIDFDTTVDWRASQLLLKAAFPVDVLAERAVYDVQFGNVERPTHRNTSWEQAKFEVCAHKWADLSEYGYGVALLNNCKYGYDIHDGVMRLTLIKSGIFPYPEADQEIHRFTYALYPHAGDFRAGRVVQEAYDLNCPLIGWQTEGKQENGIGVWGDGENAVMRKTIAAFTGIPHTGFSLLRVRAENVIVETVKQAEDGDGIVIRLYEAYGKRTRTAVETPILAGKQLWACGCMENRLQELKHDGERAEIAIKPYEILTLRIS